MCGIVGQFSWNKPVEYLSMQNGLDVISHRGPDGQGIWLSDNKNIALGHCRLSVIDIENGSQPLFNENKSIVAIVNGEFYGFKKIRQNLIDTGHKFVTNSDSEILIHLYEEYGIECLKHLRGEFAFILWDNNKQRLFAARDRFGIKPLCYSINDNRVYLASEAKALFKMGVKAKWDKDSFYHAMSLQYTPEDKTLFKNINQLPAGHILLAENNNIRVHKYWDMNYPKQQENTAYDEQALIKECHDNLSSAIKDRLKADVPVCFHLSGGIDSSAVLGIASKISSHKLDAFTVSFDHDDYDELELADNMAKYVNANLNVVNVSQDDIIHALPDAVYHSEGLAINGHLAAKFLLNKAISKAGFKVALTGEGADEVLAGYPHLRQDIGIHNLKDTNQVSAGVMMSLGKKLPLTVVQKKLGYIPEFIKAKACLGYRLHSILSKDYLESFSKTDCYSQLMDNLAINEQLTGRHIVNQSLYIWTKFALTNYILRTLGDGMEMSQSVEGRLPFLDHNLFEFLKKLPMDLKIKGSTEKYILREAVKPYVTKEIYNRQKHPFMAPPVSSYSNDNLNSFIQDELRSTTIQFFDHKKLVNLLDNIQKMHADERQAMEPVLMTALSANLLQKQFGL